MTRQTANVYSLLHALESFFDSLPENLVSAAQLELVKNAADFFPPLLRLALECRLNSHQQVDLQLCIRRDEDDLRSIFKWVKKNFTTTDYEQEKIVAFFRNWANKSSSYYKNIIEVFLELDVLPSGNRIPLLFFALEPGLSAIEVKNHFSPILRQTLGDRTFLNLFETVADSCPDNAFVAYLGLLFSRDIDVLRVNIKKLSAADVIPFLQKIGYTWISPALEDWITFIYSYADRVTVCIDIGKNIFPKIGFECFWNEQPAMETKWMLFMDELIRRNLCRLDKVDTVLAWDNEIFPSQISTWPPHLWIQSLSKPENQFTVLRKKLSHIKLSYCTGQAPEVKAYLGYGNIWLTA
ncbi:MAG: hypothetical protein JWR67_772 [Mucilaginibacter sp.]|nr:hypothetical protein [Mucilaginibacter sp.]MDB5109658.1 hypothetical protein [Mucilaginibacter sp.]